jgi:hypothetical protein
MEREFMQLLLILPFLFTSFYEKWTIPDGRNSYGTVLVGDLNNNSYPDLVVRRNAPYKVMFYELDSLDQWQVRDSLYSPVDDYILWAWGDFDVDGLTDIALQTTFGVLVMGVAIYESADSFSYPL